MTESSSPVAAKTFPCGQCGADLRYNPGTAALSCAYCGHQNRIPQSEADIEELDFHAYLQQAGDDSEVLEEKTVTCDGCGANISLGHHVSSDDCPFCGGTIVATAVSTRRIKPRSLLPFKVPQEQALDSFRRWLGSLWFAPNDLKKRARSDSRISGIYLPFWTYDANTTSFYRGERGDDYYETKTEVVRDSKGNTRTRTRRVKRTRWRSASGTVWNRFDDILVNATDSLPTDYVAKLEPWDLHNLEPFDDGYLSGFRSEVYKVDLESGFDVARGIMDTHIRSDIRRDIGGDHQRIHSVNTRHEQIRFKHILLPVWLSAYRYQQRVYRFMVNARTGEVQGERPWSWIKISLAIILLGLIVLAITHSQ